MTEYDYSPAAHAAYQRKLKGVGNWAQDVSRYDPVNPFATPSDRETTFYTQKPKSKTKSSKPRRAKSLLSYGAEISSDEDEDGPDRPPTPPRNAGVPGQVGYPGYPPNPYAQPSFAPQQGGTWQTSPTGYVTPPIPHRSPPPTIFSNTTLQPLVPTFNNQTNLWEYREQHPQQQQQQRPTSLHSSSKSKSRSRRSKRTGSLPPGLSLGQVIYPNSLTGSPHAQPSPLNSPPLYGYSASQPSMSTIYLPSGHTSPASIAYASLPTPHSAPVPQTSMQHQQQLAAQARFQQANAGRTTPVMPGAFPGMQYGYGYGYGQPMMSPPLPNVPSASYPGYHSGASTPVRMGYVSPSNASVMSSPQHQQAPYATVIMDSKKKSRDSGSSFFGRLSSSGNRKKK